MDSDPPQDPRPRKVKFVPRAPPRRVPKLEVKPEKVEEEEDASQARDLLRRFNESEMKAKHKVEKKVSSSQIAFGYGGEAASIKSYGGIPRGGNNINGSSAFGGAREKEYKEPWDYYSNYPTTLPLRRPYSGNPELLDQEEFGEGAETRTYDENSINAARDLGLLEENPEANMFLIKLPATLPTTERSTAAAEGQDDKEKSKASRRGKRGEKEPSKLNELPSGFMGKMLVYKSGAIKLKLGDTLYDVTPGMNCSFAQDVVAINTAQKHCSKIGEISKHVSITPDIDSILESMANLS